LTPAVEATGGAATPVVLINIKDTLALNSGTLIAGTSTSGATDRKETRFQFQEIFAYIHGTHSMKFGGDIQKIKSTFIDLSDASGTWNFDSAGDFLANTPSRYRQNFLTSSTQHNTYTGLYAQDEWRVKPNLLISYGLRFEDESIVRDLNNWGRAWPLLTIPSRLVRLSFAVARDLLQSRAAADDRRFHSRRATTFL